MVHLPAERTAESRGDEAVRLPVVVVTSVIRSAYQGESHGGVYLVDLETGDQRLVIDWDDARIDWTGRGGDRGLRGVAFWGGRTYLAASDEVFIYSREFELLGSITNPYLRHCHEIDISGDRLYLTSCGFDSILEYSLADERFVQGYCVRPARAALGRNRALGRLSPELADRVSLPKPRLRVFDPCAPGGPAPADTCHINSVRSLDGELFLCGRRLNRIYAVRGEQLEPYATVPLLTHNAQPFRDGVIVNDTASDEVLFTDRSGRVRRRFAVKQYDEDALENVDLARGKARQGFGRGLTVWGDHHLIAGSSPATVSVHRLDTGETVTSVNLSMDVRNAVHGLEVWSAAPE